MQFRLLFGEIDGRRQWKNSTKRGSEVEGMAQENRLSSMQVGVPGGRGHGALLAAAAVVVIIAGLKAGGPLFVPFVLAVFLSAMGVPLIAYFRRRNLPDWLAVTLVMLVLTLAVGVVLVLLAATTKGFAARAPWYQKRLTFLALDWARKIEALGIPLSVDRVKSMLDPGAVVGLVGGMLKGLLATLSNALLVLLTVIFILAEAAGFPRKLRMAMGRPDADLSHWARMADDVNRYLAYKSAISLATGVLLGLWCWILGVDFPVLWGLLAFLFNFIPNIGSILAAVPPVLLALVQFGIGRTLAVAGGYVAVNMVVGNVIEPMVFGRKLGLSNLVVFLSLVFWGWIWGPVGMLLSVPLTMVVKLALEHSEQYHWVAVLLGPTSDPGRVQGSGGVDGGKNREGTANQAACEE